MADVTVPTRFTRSGPSTDPLREKIREGLAKALVFFRDRKTAAGVAARRLVGRPADGDADLADHLIRERRRKSRMDGSIDGSLVATARATWELLDLGAPRDHAAIVRFTGFLLGRQDLPGRWGEAEGGGQGFFSPAPIEQGVAPLALTTGVVIDDERDARFVASCIALRSVLRAGRDDRERVRAHVQALLEIGSLPLALEFVVLGTVGLASPDHRHAVAALAEAAVARQEENGEWPGIPLFHALEALSTIPTEAAQAGIHRALPGLLARQRASGTFDPDDREDLTLIAVRALTTGSRALR